MSRGGGEARGGRLAGACNRPGPDVYQTRSGPDIGQDRDFHFFLNFNISEYIH